MSPEVKEVMHEKHGKEKTLKKVRVKTIPTVESSSCLPIICFYLKAHQNPKNSYLKRFP